MVEVPADRKQQQNEIPNERVADNAEPDQQVDDQQPDQQPNQQHNQRVGATLEETFMNEVRNVGEQRRRRPPNRFDDECYLADDITADINKPINLDEAFSGENSAQWK